MKTTGAHLACGLALITATYLAVCLLTAPSATNTSYPFRRVTSSTSPAATTADVKIAHPGRTPNHSGRAKDHRETSHTCQDNQPGCVGWRDQGECIANPVFMLEACAEACGLCNVPKPVADKVTLNCGAQMPSVGFGTAGLGSQTVPAVHAALQAGYTLLDTAQAPEWYREDLVGEAIQSSPVSRSALFLTTKLHPRHHGFNSTLSQIHTSFANLRTDHLDLVLLHYPRCWRELCGDRQPQGSWQDSRRALEHLSEAGKVRCIGVSNFDLSELGQLWRTARIKPAVVQRNSDPLNPDTLVQQYARLTGMQYQGYSTLGSQWLMKGYDYNPVLSHPAVLQAAKHAQRSPAAVVLRWALQQGQAVIPRSSNPMRIKGNIVLDFLLPQEDMHSISAMAEAVPG